MTMMSCKGQSKLKELRKDPEWVAFDYNQRSKAQRLRFANNKCEGYFTGKTHSELSKAKISKATKGKRSGNKNSQYGTVWIYSSVYKKSIKVPKDELDLWVSKGWLKGRKMIFN